MTYGNGQCAQKMLGRRGDVAVAKDNGPSGHGDSENRPAEKTDKVEDTSSVPWWMCFCKGT